MKQTNTKLNHMYQRFRVFTEMIGDALIPKNYRQRIHYHLDRASITTIPYYKLGIGAYIIMILSIISSIIMINIPVLINVPVIAKTVVAIIGVIFYFTIYTFLTAFSLTLLIDLRIYKKERHMERVFPEFLSELSLNLKAGNSLLEALENSTEKEFGPLNDEIARITQTVRLGKSIDDAITNFTKRLNL